MSVSNKYCVVQREDSGQPKVMTVHTETEQFRSSCPYLVKMDLKYQAAPNGFPTPSEFKRINHLEDLVDAGLKALGAQHVGRISGGGTTTVAYYAPTKIQDSLTVKTGLFKKEIVQFEIRHDPSWSWFQTVMEPTPEEIENGLDLPLFQQMAQHGDNPSLPRPTDFFAYFPSAATRNVFVEQMAELGYKLAENGATSNGRTPNPFGCQLIATVTMDREPLAKRCVDLRTRARALGGDFDEWGAPIAK